MRKIKITNFTAISFIRLLVFIFILSLVISSKIIYAPWSQITYFHTHDFNTYPNLIKTIPILYHLLRYIVASPALHLSDIFQIKSEIFYGIHITINLFITSLIWEKLTKENIKLFIVRLTIIIFPFFLLLVINGRFSFSLLGLSIIIYQAVKRIQNKSRRFILDYLGLLFTSVSSGTLLTGGIIFLCSNYEIFKNEFSREFSRLINFRVHLKKTTSFFLKSSLLSILFFYLIIFTRKNLLFFGGINLDGISNMLSHGIGLIFRSDYIAEKCVGGILCSVANAIYSDSILKISLYLISLCIIVILVFLINSKGIYKIKKYTILASIIGGIFGLTAFLSIITIIPIINFKNPKVER